MAESSAAVFDCSNTSSEFNDVRLGQPQCARNRTLSLCDRPSLCTAMAARTTVLRGAVAACDRDLRNKDTAACCRVFGGYCCHKFWISGPGRLFTSVS